MAPVARTPWPVLVLCFLLTIWNPASLAIIASASLIDYGPRSVLSVLFLTTRFAVTSIGLAAGRALWLRRPGAVRFAQIALALFAVEALVRYSTRIDLSLAPPGTRLPRALFIIVHNAAWFFYLDKSRRVRQVYGLESQPYKE